MTDQSKSDQGVPPVDVPEAGVPGLILPDPPSKAKLAWATLAALGVAGVVLVSAILGPSQNWIADQLVRTIGADKGAEGSWSEGFSVIGGSLEAEAQVPLVAVCE